MGGGYGRKEMGASKLENRGKMSIVSLQTRRAGQSRKSKAVPLSRAEEVGRHPSGGQRKTGFRWTSAAGESHLSPVSAAWDLSL